MCLNTLFDDTFNIHEDPVELINVPKTDSHTLTTLIKGLSPSFLSSSESMQRPGI